MGEDGKMKELSAYNVKTRKKTDIKNPQLVTLKNGRKAIKGIAADDGKTTLFRMISDSDAKNFQTGK
jgi:hypothetical protein